MDLFEAINNRRSIRKFSGEVVSNEIIEKLIRAAMMAPSAGNQQPWEFMVVKNPEILEKMSKVSPYASFVKNAGAAIIVCGVPAREKFSGFWPIDCSAAIENLLLAAHGLNLGATWCGMYPMMQRATDLRKILGIPNEMIPIGLIPIGIPVSHPSSPNRFDPNRIHWEFWE